MKTGMTHELITAHNYTSICDDAVWTQAEERYKRGARESGCITCNQEPAIYRDRSHAQ